MPSAPVWMMAAANERWEDERKKLEEEEIAVRKDPMKVISCGHQKSLAGCREFFYIAHFLLRSILPRMALMSADGSFYLALSECQVDSHFLALWICHCLVIVPSEISLCRSHFSLIA